MERRGGKKQANIKILTYQFSKTVHTLDIWFETLKICFGRHKCINA